jgi:hypothetical protein
MHLLLRRQWDTIFINKLNIKRTQTQKNAFHLISITAAAELTLYPSTACRPQLLPQIGLPQEHTDCLTQSLGIPHFD